ncbi:MAG: type III secretion system chaperone, partial [Pseudomonadota bacterium]
MAYAVCMTIMMRRAGRKRRPFNPTIICAFAALSVVSAPAIAAQLQSVQVTEPKSQPGKGAEGKKAGPKAESPKRLPGPIFEGQMTLTRIDEILRRLDENVKAPQPGSWQLTISERPVIIVTDMINNRMRIISPISKTEGMPEALLKRLMQANFDTALDARYAIAKGVLWATYIHPLRALHDRQFISAIGQTVNLALTFGSTFSSGGMSFGGGDSRDIIRKQLIEKLMKKGLPI